MGFFDRKENEEMQEDVAVVAQEDEKVVEMPKKKPFQAWHVGDETFRMKLDTSGVSEIQNQPDECNGHRQWRNACTHSDAGCGTCGHEKVSSWSKESGSQHYF